MHLFFLLTLEEGATFIEPGPKASKAGRRALTNCARVRFHHIAVVTFILATSSTPEEKKEHASPD